MSCLKIFGSIYISINNMTVMLILKKNIQTLLNERKEIEMPTKRWEEKLKEILKRLRNSYN